MLMKHPRTLLELKNFEHTLFTTAYLFGGGIGHNYYIYNFGFTA